jgi:linoleoyl-CoA desaturase
MEFARFNTANQAEFFLTLRKRVNQYFEQKQIDRYANTAMRVKTVAMLAMYFVPYFLCMAGLVTNSWVYFASWILMGFGMAGIGLSVMHDANHGAYSKNRKVNDRIGLILNFIGGNAPNWKIQHNQLHHSFTNIHGADEDIAGKQLLRFSPHDKWRKMHQYQHYYAWFLYSLMTISWISAKEFKQFSKYRKEGFISDKDYKSYFNKLLFTKVFYLVYTLVLPLILVPLPIWLIVVSFIGMHLVAGFILSCIFQPAHVVPTSHFPLPDENGMMENSWAVHQLNTTANFAPKNALLGWYAGGLNYQVEHHLFPNICHIHYKNIAPIVKQTAEEFGLPYHSNPTFWSALREHGRTLKEFGKPSNLSVA